MNAINPKHMEVNLNYHNRRQMESYVIDLSAVVDTSLNIIDESAYLNGIYCDVIFSGTNAKRIELFDTSGIPTGTEENKFSFIISNDFPQHDTIIPKDGLLFKNGIGLICSDLGGGGSGTFLSTNFLYTKIS